MRVFAYSDYKQLVLDRVQAAPGKGRGVLQKLAAAVELQPSMISQVLRGKRDLSVDQAALAAKFLGLSELETEYFIQLVQRRRAQTPELARLTDRRLGELRALAEGEGDLGRTDASPRPSATDLSVYYSQWLYSAVRILSSIEQFKSVAEIAHKLGEPPHLVRRIVDFLLEAGFCVPEPGSGGERLRPATLATQVPADDSLNGTRHVLNWRIKALQTLQTRDRTDGEDLFKTKVVSISRADREQFGRKLEALLDELQEKLAQTRPEEVICLNIDWYSL